MNKNFGKGASTILGVATVIVGLPACQSVSDLPSRIDPNPNPNSIRETLDDRLVVSDGAAEDLKAAQLDESSNGNGLNEELIYGDQEFFAAAPMNQADTSVSGNDSLGETFVFRNAPIVAVLNEILGETYGLNYSVDPTIKGNISLRLDGITSEDQAMAGLNAALNLQGVEIVETGGSFIIGRKGQNRSSTSTPFFLGADEILPPGTSLAVQQIRFASVEEVTTIARSMLGSDVIKYSDDARGFIVLSGAPEEVSSAAQLLKSLDVNWLNAVSTALIPVQNARPSELAADLEPVLSRLGGVSVVPLDRLETLMVISRQRETLDQTREWIARLDQDANPKVLSDILVYEARYVNAEDLIALTESSSPINNYLQKQGFGQPSSDRPNPGRQQSTFPIESTNFANDNLYQNLSIRVDPGRNAIVARGAPSELQSLSKLLSMLDKPKRQVLIEATIVEVSLSDGNSFGINWDFIEDRVSATFSDAGSGEVASLFPGMSVSYINTDVAAVVNALASTSDVEIVSAPRMMVLNNETARLQIGDQVPIITQSAVSVTDPGAPVVNSTTYRDTGVILTVTPKIRAGGMVEIEISQEVSSVSETISSTIDSPTISQRSIESVLAVPDGSTAILGGLMSSTRSYSQTGVPFLKDTPVLGAMFRSTKETERRTELVVLIEPSVVLAEEPMMDIPQRLRQALIRARMTPKS